MAPDPLKTPIRSTTQEHLDIEDIQDSIVILKNGSCCLVLETNAVNFGLLSETEQDAIIYAYAGLLNSLSFPIQITIRSQKKDVTSYLKLIDAQEKKQTSPKIKSQIKKYRQFIENLVKENDVLDKKFYITVVFSSLELGITTFGKNVGKRKLPFSKEYILEKARASLSPKREQIIRQFGRLGLRVVQLNTQQLLDLFYHIYNPESHGQKLVSPREYETFLVEPSVEKTGLGETRLPPVQKTNPRVSVNSAGQKPLQGQKFQQQIEQIVQKTKGLEINN